MSSESKPLRIAIAGGGIGGLALAIALRRVGHQPHVYEAAHHFSEIGAGVSFGPNSQRAMALVDPAVKEGYDRRATVNAYDKYKETWFTFRWGMDREGGSPKPEEQSGQTMGDVVAPGCGQNSVHRAHFLDEMVKLFPSEHATFGKRLVSYDDNGDKGVTLSFEDGTTAEADCLIGCDGIKSHVRPILIGQDHPAAHAVFSGKYAYRGLIPMEKAVAAIGDELARNAQMYLGYHGHMLTFPIEKGATMNVVAFASADKWENPQWVIPMQKERRDEDFKAWGPQVKKILSLMEKPDVWALFNHPPAPTYYKGRVAILGDAAHATTPHNGAGAGMAIEDAYVLANILSDVKEPKDIEAAFSVYDETRRERTQRLVESSRESGQIYEFEGKDTGDDMHKIHDNLSQRYKWIWNEDLEEELAEAKRKLAKKMGSS